MRTHHRLTTFVFGAAIIAMFLALAVPSHASAAPHHNHGLTIQSTPDPSTAGQGVLIYGQLKGPANADRRIVLFHRINPAPHFTPISVTRTNAAGFYEFVRADGVVVSNRNWFVRGPDFTHSRTIHERVSAVVTLTTSSAGARRPRLRPLDFTGTVVPNHRHERVLLQQQNSTSGNGWQTIASGYTTGASSFAIAHRFRSPGSYTLRAYFPGDPRNIAGQSDTHHADRPAAAEPVVHDLRLGRGHHRRPDGDDLRHVVRGRLDHHPAAERLRDALREAGLRWRFQGARERDDRQLG